ncbi:hypothetical protein VCHA50P417_250029 [Vibrio chagasii]|nr:hypothetical protein VCHA50P417_250029 [Vibrio chagasii]
MLHDYFLATHSKAQLMNVQLHSSIIMIIYIDGGNLVGTHIVRMICFQLLVLLKSESNRALERQTTYMNVSWQSTLVASQTKMLEYPAKAKSAIVKAMLCLCYMNFASHFFINHSPDL